MGGGWKSYCQRKGINVKSYSGVTIPIAILIISLPIFFIGMRTNFIDTKSYMRGFELLSADFSSISSMSWDKGITWNIYLIILKKFITKNPTVFLLITAIIQGGALLKLYYKYSPDYVLSLILFFLSCAFTNMMNGIRQFMAVCLIIYFIDWLFQKKNKSFLFIILIAMTIHFSALIWIPATFLVQGKPWNKKMMLASFAVVLAVSFVDEFTGLLSSSIEETSYAGYTSQFDNDDGSSFFHTLIAAVPVVITFIYRKKIFEINNRQYYVLINIATMGVIISLLANFTSGILIGRMPIYFTVFNYALYPYIFKETVGNKNARWFQVMCILGYLLYAIYYMRSFGNGGMPYISSILGINTWN